MTNKLKNISTSFRQETFKELFLDLSLLAMTPYFCCSIIYPLRFIHKNHNMCGTTKFILHLLRSILPRLLAMGTILYLQDPFLYMGQMLLLGSACVSTHSAQVRDHVFCGFRFASARFSTDQNALVLIVIT